MVVATGGNAVDGHVLKKKILSLVLSSITNEPNNSNGLVRRLSKNVANLLQVATQDVDARESAPLLAVSSHRRRRRRRRRCCC
jgi:hypothetical protein